MTAGQPFDLEAELAQSFLREADLPVFKGILVTAAHEERELIASCNVGLAQSSIVESPDRPLAIPAGGALPSHQLLACRPHGSLSGPISVRQRQNGADAWRCVEERPNTNVSLGTYAIFGRDHLRVKASA